MQNAKWIMQIILNIEFFLKETKDLILKKIE